MSFTIIIGLFCVLAFILLFLQQQMIYHPRAYDIPLSSLGVTTAQPLRFQTSCGRQTAFYVPPKNGAAVPELMWVMFHGNASLALDLLDLIELTPDPTAGCLLIDYPGYGDCQGKASPQAILESSEKAMTALAGQLKTTPETLYKRLRIFGYSLGAASALQLAVRHDVERVVLVAPFTSMLDMAKRTVGWPLCTMLRHRFDNRARLAELAKRPHRPEVVIIHGASDTLIPPAMSRELSATAPGWIQYQEIPGADHIFVIEAAAAQIHHALGPKL